MAEHWLEGEVQRLLWSSERTGYAVLRFHTADDQDVIVVGNLGVLAEGGEGTFAALEGRWEQHAVHGRQFRATGLINGSPRSLEGMRMYLGSSGVQGVGPRLASRIVDRFGLRTPVVIQNEPQRLAEVDGIGPARARAISEAWRRDEAGRALSMTLRGLGISGRLIGRVQERYGEQAPQVVATDPYRLAEDIRGIGFKTADALARHQGMSPDDPRRARAAVVYVLERDSGEGHCFLTRGQVRQALSELDVPPTHLDEAIDAVVGTGRAVIEAAPGAMEAVDDDRVWSAALHQAEHFVATELRRRCGLPSHPPPDDEILRAERWVGVDLDPDQRAAVRLALGGGVVVITGGPGTGKTTLVRVLLRAVEERGHAWSLASPTGRAAKRLAEASGRPASTLHRLLEYRPDLGGFQRKMTNPLDAEGLVVDEVSMVDLPLMHALLDAIPFPGDGFHLVLVGDADQLPSVGPGQVLRDIVDSGVVPVARLTRVHRQALDSGIVAAATAIHQGEVPTSGERGGRPDAFLLSRDEAERARDTVIEVVAERLARKGFDPRADVQVLAPTRRGPLGTAALNKALQDRLNPDAPALERGDQRIRVGDRVICTRNRYDVEVFNGDMGIVLSIDKAGLEIDFDGRRVEWSRDDLNLIELAYAITVHKSQGSEYPAVVLALHGAHGIMLRRKLFYTAVTRAKRFLCVVGSARAWYRAVREQGGDERNTALAERLRQ